ncbi:MAG: alpha/beta hydrolase [Oscillatoriales cyanobacterium]|nr:MAG: alpha/beta hydrolase [Oscillatoriales cyanobacterium]TAE02701.1 MAG: alpha/beta hydrolase [Oscillatoriales cyanobacterium]TAF00234.1 MAG: alpha/beta hydrolase [Oscillatoriales cyanobacterium]TAF43785.1 MAG: alpha/beta hydrolase [Oscillatoriales cyanobacterium]TAF70224.1 MAG: alpha/beta hydrolase [Oscillatoriales cyanobacterium]
MQPQSSTQDVSAIQSIKSPTLFYEWQSYRCAYEVYRPTTATEDSIPLLLIHPIGVGLSRVFWQRFCESWNEAGYSNPIYNPDLLGCGDCEMPAVACYPDDWAAQLQFFLETVVKKPAIVLVQGALLSVALALAKIEQESSFNLMQGLVLAGPPAWGVMNKHSTAQQQRIVWNLLDSPLGNAFYRYARRAEFLRSFSIKQLFGDAAKVDSEWLDALQAGAANPDSRHAVFSFLAGFWRQDYSSTIQKCDRPALVIMGEQASSISQAGKEEKPEERLAQYLANFPSAEGLLMPGRNVLPYESTAEFVAAVAEFVKKLNKREFGG